MDLDSPEKKTKQEMEWDEHWKMAVDQAKILGFPLPANYKELTLEEQQKVASDFAKWEDHRQAQLEQQKQAFEDEERKWKELLDEAHATGYPQLPDNPSLLSSDERNAFAYKYNEWKGRIDELFRSAAEARAAGYGIPSPGEFIKLSVAQKGEVVKAYKDWKDERAALVEQFVQEAGTAGYPLPDSMQQMTYVQQNEIFEEYSRWNSQNQQTTEVAALNPIPSAAESLKKAKAQEEMQWERKQGFKATLDGNVARNA